MHTLIHTYVRARVRVCVCVTGRLSRFQTVFSLSFCGQRLNELAASAKVFLFFVFAVFFLSTIVVHVSLTN